MFQRRNRAELFNLWRGYMNSVYAFNHTYPKLHHYLNAIKTKGTSKNCKDSKEYVSQ